LFGGVYLQTTIKVTRVKNVSDLNAHTHSKRGKPDGWAGRKVDKKSLSEMALGYSQKHNTQRH